jgi:hypothetical protein
MAVTRQLDPDSRPTNMAPRKKNRRNFFPVPLLRILRGRRSIHLKNKCEK